jgi:integrase
MTTPAATAAFACTPAPRSDAVFINAGAGAEARKHRRRTVAAFATAFTDVEGWGSAPMSVRLAAPVAVRAFAAWCALTHQAPIDVTYVDAAATSWGRHVALVHPGLAATFTTTACRIGFTGKQTRRQWAILAKLTAITGLRPDQLHRHRFNTARDDLIAVVGARHGGRVPLSLTTPLHGLEATLAALGILDQAAPKPSSTDTRREQWATLTLTAPVLTATMRRYLAQVGVSLRPGSAAVIDTTLRHLAAYLLDYHPDVTSVAQISRTHIEGFKAWLVARPGYRGRRQPVKSTIGMRMSNLRSFFERIIEWGYPDAPTRNPVFAGDRPIKDRPLPRFLDDPDAAALLAAALLAAARKLPKVFDRVCVEVLARTGLRKGEFLGLTIDAIVQIGEGQWLRTPVGKLHTDRYIPLHPRVKALLDEWIAHRGEQPESRLMFIDRGRPIPQTRVDTAVQLAATNAGVGHVSPHQLRHTLATQAINRGMSLEAIAALLGHASMTMTLTYARIADRTVAQEYFAVSEKVEALYEPAPLPADAEGPNMRALRIETDRRLLGNGYCTRAAELACRYETICETCSCFAPTIAFRDTLQNQHDDADTHDDTHRKQIYATILSDLDKAAS